MTREEQVDALGPYVRDVADRIGLRDWALELKYAIPNDPDSLAEVVNWNGRKLADLYFCFDFFGLAPEKQRQIICHELIHCHFAAAGFEVEESSDPRSYRSYVRCLEYGVDAMADAIAPFMPLPGPPPAPMKAIRKPRAK